jgi:adenylate kinase family enzyme
MGSGKTTYCHKLVGANPSLIMISRDAILTEFFGSAWLHEETGGHFFGLEVMWKRVADALRQDDVSLILDTWSGSSDDRKEITTKLRELGADWIAGYCFITPEETALRWHIERQSVGQEEWHIKQLNAQNYADNFRHDCRLFHSYGVTLEQGFDQVYSIDPRTCDFRLPDAD